MKNTQATMPHMGQWVTPTLNPEELQKRIDELRTVQFWLEQNSRMLAATIQALEVQRMTLAALKNMNVSAADLKSAMNMASPTSESKKEKPDPEKKPQTPPVDPTQWWNKLTEQFDQLATQVLKDSTPAKVAPSKKPAPKHKAPIKKQPKGEQP